MNDIQDTTTNKPLGRYVCKSTGVRRLLRLICKIHQGYNMKMPLLLVEIIWLHVVQPTPITIFLLLLFCVVII